MDFAPIEPIAPFYFEPSSAELVREDAPRIDALADYLAAVPAARVRIVGHADSDPIFNAQFYSNEHLSAVRAAMIKQKLQWRGVAAERIEVAARSADQPVQDNATEVGRSKNRRVEVQLLWPEKRVLRYASGIDALDDGTQRALAELAAPLLSTPSLGLVIEGHADTQRPAAGTHADNVALARARAQGVADALVALGVRPSQLRVDSKGDTAPIADNATLAGRAANRRVEVEYVPPQSYELSMETYAPTGQSPIELVQQIQGGYPSPIETTMRSRDRAVVRAMGQLEGMESWAPPQAAGLRWNLLDAASHSDRWVAGYTDADTSASGLGTVARVGSKWQWALAAQSVRPAEVRWDTTAGDDAARWSISSPDTLYRQSTLKVADHQSGQALLTAALHSQEGQRLLVADTLAMPVDAAPWWQWNVAQQADSSGAVYRVLELVYRGLKPLSLVHVGEQWNGAVSPEGDDPSLLYRDDRVVKIWRDVQPGDRLLLRYRTGGPPIDSPQSFVQYQVEGMWCEEPLVQGLGEDGK
jgi:flagellar motor protein MotB